MADLISLPGTRDHAWSVMSQAISDGYPVLVEGPVGSGKTSFVRHVAQNQGEEIAKNMAVVQLSEQMDGKAMFGGYQCTEVPGEFQWVPGPITKAVEKGSWILLEDVDYAPYDFLGHLVSLIEKRSLTLTGRGTVQAHENFQLFATRRTTGGFSVESKDLYLNKFWIRVRLAAFTQLELIRLTGSRFSTLDQCCRRIVEIFSLFVTKNSELDLGSRILGTRDLMKWCRRISTLNDVTNDPLGIFREASDILTAFIPSVKSRLSAMHLLASQLNVTKEQVEYYALKHKPEIRIRPKSIGIGRIESDRLREDEQIQSNERFALTRPAANLLERIMVCLNAEEPVLLVGETGCGKTAAVHFVAKYSGRNLHIVNLSQQSESADLFGGFKPVGLQTLIKALNDEYLKLFRETFPMKKNKDFMKHIHACYDKNKWEELLKLMEHTAECGAKKNSNLSSQWTNTLLAIRKFIRIVKKETDTMPFAFVEGVLLKAMICGDWILLDEINLASPETLSGLCNLLETSQQSNIFLENRSDPVTIHKDFRILGCMNPATDVAKRNLPPGLRNRFTEIFVEEPSEVEDLILLAESYLQGMSVPSKLLNQLVDFYRKIKERSPTLTSDSWGHCPHYSLRTFCRALDYGSKNTFGNTKRSLFEAFCMSFLTELEPKSHDVVLRIITEFVLGKNPNVITQILSTPCNPPSSGNYRKVEGYWIECGDEQAESSNKYVITPGVRKNLRDLARIVAAKRYPVLLQGETSVGKTSLIAYLARMTGNTCIRINNHEHTDLQEYLGSYVSDPEDGKLKFVEGPLIRAMRKGHWVVLDELNLAPPDILEALNRVLDDNREIFIPETQTVVKADPRFTLLATQNPAGLYGGRKQLSRAFRNRFVELHFSELPPSELEEILHRRCSLPESYAKKMVSVLRELQIYRNSAGMFSGKESYMTLRDLFRWGERYSTVHSDGSLHDWDQYIADQGYFVLAGRCRRDTDSDVVRQVLEKQMKRKVDPQTLFSPESPYLTLKVADDVPGFEGIVWTKNLLRMAVLVGQSVLFKEPVLLVGDTGCGKTSLCQMLAQSINKQLLIINCHLMTEAADFLGRLRPESAETFAETGVLFSWYEGPLVRAMKAGHPILIDEISLAEDSVLERLNSVLEPERGILLAEQASGSEVPMVTAKEGFSILATMNPGGDYGKKELSKALRNRFTEIWCDSEYEKTDLISIVEKNLGIFLPVSDTFPEFSESMVDFVSWYLEMISDTTNSILTVRDILAWVHFVNSCGLQIGIKTAYVEGAFLAVLDGIGANSTACRENGRLEIVEKCRNYLKRQIGDRIDLELVGATEEPGLITSEDGAAIGIPPFYIKLGDREDCISKFNFSAPTCRRNAFKVMRAMQIEKPVLLEGPPGVGKSSIVIELAKRSRQKLTRLNFSDQTDLSDLFGCDMPVVMKNGDQGFAWMDGPLLTAMKDGHWILMDEMNLASQSVLEGLNACLDHRGEVYISELGKTFPVKKDKTRFFACQNPFRQGGDRRGLPKSFLNRFSVVYVDELTSEDEEIILKSISEGCLKDEEISKLVQLNGKVNALVLKKKEFGQIGSPWEFNLRDLIRWAELCSRAVGPDDAFRILYRNRMRTHSDREKMNDIFAEVYGRSLRDSPKMFWMTNDTFQVGGGILRMEDTAYNTIVDCIGPARLLKCQLPYMESLMQCVKMSWLAILEGPSAVGKSTLVKSLAKICKKELNIFNITSETDAVELLGSFEQVSSLQRQIYDLVQFCNTVKGVDTIVLTEMVATCRKAIAAKNYDELRACSRDLKACLPSEYVVNVEKLEAGLEDPEKTSSLCFQWIDSPLLEAYRDGKWLLLENVNSCSPAVLDRLNAALEPNGTLTLPERGLLDGKSLSYTAHPNFRVFFTLNPKHGPISRAMRNRGVEIFVLDTEAWFKNSEDFKDVIGQFSMAKELLNELLHRSINVPTAGGYSSLHAGYQAQILGPECSESQVNSVWEDCLGKLPCDEQSSSVIDAKDERIESVLLSGLMENGVSIISTLHSEAWMLAGCKSGSDGLLAASKHLIFSATQSNFSSRLELIDSFLTKKGRSNLKSIGGKVDTLADYGLTWDPRYFDQLWSLYSGTKSISRKKLKKLLITCDNLLVQCCFLWGRIKAETLKKANMNSVVRFGQKLANKKIDANDLPLVLIPDLMEFRKALRKLISDESFDCTGHAEELISLLFDVETFDHMCHAELERSCAVGLQLIWQEMNLSQSPFSIIQGSESLSATAKTIDKSWKVQDLRAQLYLAIYEGFAPLDPFSYMDTIRLCSEILELGRLENLTGSDGSKERRMAAYDLICSETSVETALKRVIEQKKLMTQRTPEETNSVSQHIWGQIIESAGCGALRTEMLARGLGTGRELEIFCFRNSGQLPVELILSKHLSWKQSESAFLWLQWLNGAPMGRCLDERVGFRLRNVHFMSLPVLAEASLSLVEEMRWSSIPENLSLSQTEQLKALTGRMCGSLWKQGTTMGQLAENIKRGITSVKTLLIDVLNSATKTVNCSENFREKLNAVLSAGDFDSDNFLIKLGLVICELSLPPKGLLDPVEKEAAQKCILELQLSSIECEIGVIKRFHRLVTSEETYYMEGSQHPHPYMAAFIRRQDFLKDKLASMDYSKNYVREPGQTFELMAAEMNGFYQLTETALAIYSSSGYDLEQPTRTSLQQNLSKMQGWLVSAERFSAVLMTDFIGFPDVFSPYMLGLMLCQTGANLLCAHYSRNLGAMEFQHSLDGKTSANEVTAFISSALTLISEKKADPHSMFQLWLKEDSLIPLNLQLVHVTIGTSFDCVVPWLIRQWKSLREREAVDGEEQDKLQYEYRQKKRPREDEAPDDAEDKEIEKRFPTFALEENEETSLEEQSLVESAPVSRSQLVIAVRTALELIKTDKSNWEPEFLTALWLNMMQTSGAIDIRENSVSVGAHLLNLWKLMRALSAPSDRSICSSFNVYKEASLNEMKRCRELVAELKRATGKLKNDWPDVAALDLVDVTIDRILNLSVGTPLMKMAVTVEGLLENCEQWELVASRAVSLESWIEPLRSLLIEWRKMEVNSWERLLDDLESERAEEANVAGLELLDACLKADAGEVRSEVAIGMAVEWMKCGELGDFSARLEALELCRRAVKGELSGQLHSFFEYHRLYEKDVKTSLTTQRSPIETELKNFVKIVKFQDLNIWSVKLSIQKAHKQLFSYVRKYQEVLSESVVAQLQIPLALKSIVKTPHSKHYRESCSMKEQHHEGFSEEESGRVGELSGAKSLTVRCEQLIAALNPLKTWSSSILECGESLESIGPLVKAPLNYSGKSEEEKTKLRKRALVSRKNETRDMIRAVHDLGFHSRRGLHLDSDKLGFHLMFGVVPTESNEVQSVNTAVQVCATWRRVFLEAAEKPNEQIGPQICGKLRGLAQLIPDVMYGRIRDLEGVDKDTKRLTKIIGFLELAVTDLTERKSMCDQQSIEQHLNRISVQVSEIASLLGETNDVWNCCPEKSSAEDWELTCMEEKSSRISTLVKDNEIYSKLMADLGGAIVTVKSILKTVNLLSLGGYTKLCQLESVIQELSKLSGVLSTVTELLGYSKCQDSPTFFDSGLIRASDLLNSSLQVVDSLKICMESPAGFSSGLSSTIASGTKSMKLAIQRCIKQSKTLETVQGVSGCLKLFIKLLSDAKIPQLFEQSEAVLDNVRRGMVISQLEILLAFVHSAKAVQSFCEQILDTVLTDLENLSNVYTRLMDISIKLLKEGFVDPIPQEEVDGDSTGATTFQDKDQAGLGEGEGAKDVTDEIEDTSQIEDTKKPAEKKEEEEGPEKMEDIHKPIEMEEDFDADLEDMNLDREEESSESDDGEEEDGEEAQPDWNMGDAEKPEEEQLDPNLWDEENKEQPLDDSSKGGDTERTEELTAKDDDGQSPQEKEDESEEKEEEDEDQVSDSNELENMDLRDMDASDGEESEGEDGEEKMEETTLDEENQTEEQVEEEKAEEPKLDDLSEMSAASQCQTGAGKSQEQSDSVEGGQESKEKDETLQEDREKEGQTGESKEDQSSGRPEEKHKRTAQQANIDRTEETRRKRKSRADKSLGDPDTEWKRNPNIKDAEKSENQETAENAESRNSSTWSHEPDLTRNSAQAIDSGTLEEAQKQHLEEIREEADETIEDTVDVQDSKKELDAESKVTAGENVVDMVEESIENTELLDDDILEEAPRSRDSTIHTVLDFYTHASRSLKFEDLMSSQLSLTFASSSASVDGASRSLWAKLQSVVQPLAAELSENLRLTLEPTQASKMEGDFRTGKRLNIRKLIPYVASNYRKDKIWLRRTKKAKRNYQVLIAVDDSSSMQDNKTRQLAYESLTLLGLSLRYLEVGQVGICKFGGETEMLYPMSSHFSDEAGAAVIGSLNFDQEKTNVNKLLEFAVSSFLSCGKGGGDMGLPSQLLLIVSDGRGLFVEGMEKVKRAVQTTLGANIFVVFVILDSPEHKNSILDIKVPVFGKPGTAPVIRSYMDFFPFPFYVILRELGALPAVVGDALRQWFEIVSDRH